MKTILTFLLVLFLSGPAVAEDLPPDTLADKATKAMESGDLQKALRMVQMCASRAGRSPWGVRRSRRIAPTTKSRRTSCKSAASRSASMRSLRNCGQRS